MPLVALLLADILKESLMNQTIDIKNINLLLSMYMDNYLWGLTLLLFLSIIIVERWFGEYSNGQPHPSQIILNIPFIFNQFSNLLFNQHQSYKQKRKIFFKSIFWSLLIGILVFSFLFGFPILGTVMARKVLALTGCEPAFDGIPACFNHGFIQSRFGPLSIWLAAFATPFVFLFQFADILFIWSFLIIFFGVLAFKK
ncbi:hypothetical protein [Neisseria sp. Ec49-e6-T10]|uniref:hypothetical protein n=1 Tax=Neisseria sp. Ec49-e6-T10 TaxID=3140744 RepID=UPI003EB92B63